MPSGEDQGGAVGGSSPPEAGGNPLPDCANIGSVLPSGYYQPCKRGSFIPVTDIEEEEVREIYLTNQLILNEPQKQFLLSKPDVAQLLYNFFKAYPTEENKGFLKELIEWMMSDNSITSDDLKYYLQEPEPDDGEYDANYWENPNTIFQQIQLPTLQQFVEHFPKITKNGGITYMKSEHVYNLVGGPLKDKFGEEFYVNACAMRGSYAFNHIKIGNSFPFRIPPGTENTEIGAHNLLYILSAKAFNTYMNKRFGDATHSITANQINGNRSELNNFLKSLRDNNVHGIYTLITNSDNYSGHVDLMTYGECLGGYALPKEISIIEKIEIWQLK